MNSSFLSLIQDAGLLVDKVRYLIMQLDEAREEAEGYRNSYCEAIDATINGDDSFLLPWESNEK